MFIMGFKCWIIYWESPNGDEYLLQKGINKKIIALISARKNYNQIKEYMVGVFSNNLSLEQQLIFANYNKGAISKNSFFDLTTHEKAYPSKVYSSKNFENDSVTISIGGYPYLIAEKSENTVIKRVTDSPNTEIISWKFHGECKIVSHPLKFTT